MLPKYPTSLWPYEQIYEAHNTYNTINTLHHQILWASKDFARNEMPQYNLQKQLFDDQSYHLTLQHHKLINFQHQPVCISKTTIIVNQSLNHPHPHPPDLPCNASKRSSSQQRVAWKLHGTLRHCNKVPSMFKCRESLSWETNKTIDLNQGIPRKGWRCWWSYGNDPDVTIHKLVSKNEFICFGW